MTGFGQPSSPEDGRSGKYKYVSLASAGSTRHHNRKSNQLRVEHRHHDVDLVAIVDVCVGDDVVAAGNVEIVPVVVVIVVVQVVGDVGHQGEDADDRQ